MDLIGCSKARPDALFSNEEEEAFWLIVSPCLGASLSDLSVVVEIVSVAPGVLGALMEEPNEAKAPEPSPKAEEAPIAGEPRVVLAEGVVALKGLDLP